MRSNQISNVVYMILGVFFLAISAFFLIVFVEAVFDTPRPSIGVIVFLFILLVLPLLAGWIFLKNYRKRNQEAKKITKEVDVEYVDLLDIPELGAKADVEGPIAALRNKDNFLRESEMEQETDSTTQEDSDLEQSPEKEESGFMATLLVGVVAGLLAMVLTVNLLALVAPNIPVYVMVFLLFALGYMAAGSAPSLLRGAPNEKAMKIALGITLVLILAVVMYANAVK